MRDVQAVGNEIRSHKREMQKMQTENQRETEKLKLEQEKRLANEKETHQYRLNDLREKQEQQVFEEIERKDRVLNTLQERVDKTKEVTDQELKNITDRHMSHIEQKEADFAIRFQDKHLNQQEAIENQHHEFDSNIRTMEDQYSQKQMDAIIDHKYEAAQRAREQQDQYEKMNTTFRQTKNLRENKFQAELHNQRAKQQEQMEAEKNRHLNFIQFNQKRYEDEMHKMITGHQDAMRKTAIQFEKEYSKMLEDQKALVADLDKKSKDLITHGKQLLSKEKAHLASQSQDDFYKMNKLYPTFQDVGDSYDIFVKVPEHEKNSVNLMVKDRMVRLTLDRRYEDTLEDSGYTNKATKIETIATSFDVPEIINSKAQVRKAYKDGLLIFNIKKA